MLNKHHRKITMPACTSAARCANTSHRLVPACRIVKMGLARFYECKKQDLTPNREMTPNRETPNRGLSPPVIHVRLCTH
jgi:hypothetical protein